MTLTRQFTRGLGERTQPRNIRTAQYPQVGLTESIIPDAVNTSVSGVDVTAIRVGNHSRPSLINSGGRWFNSGINALNLPFTGLKKGENGYGVTFANNGDGSVQIFNKVGAASYRTDQVPAFNSNQSSITSWGRITRNPNSMFSFVFAHGANTTLVDAVGGGYSLEIREGVPTGLANFNAFDMAKGGVRNIVTQNRNGRIFDYIKFKNSISHVLFLNTFLPRDTLLHFYRVSGVEPYGTLTYSQTNTNQNNNAAWLLNQRTQYNRKFDPLKLIGA